MTILLRIKLLESYKIKKQIDLDSLECLTNIEKRSKKRKVKDDFDERAESLLADRKVKTMINFENNESSSIKSLIVKG